MQFGVSESIYHWGKYRPQSIAIYSDDEIITYSELNQRINSLCKNLKNIISDEKVGLAIKNKVNFIIALASVLRLKRYNVFLNTGLPEHSLKENITYSKIKHLIYDEVNSDIVELMPQNSIKINIDKINVIEISNINPDHSATDKDVWGVLFTSGTTDTPKGSKRDHYSMVTEHIGWCLELGLNRKTKFYIGRPLFYTGGLVLAMSTLLVGGSIIINNFENDDGEEEVWLDYQKTIINLKEIDWAFFVPNQLRKFCELVKSAKEVNSAENILSMGDKISGEEKLRAYILLRSNIVESWGNSESLGTITDPEDLFLRPNSIGRPFLTDEMCIVDVENNKVITKPNIVGRIAGSDEAGFCEYVGQPEETDKVLINNMINSADLGYYDKDGYFYIKSRVQRMITRNGDQIYIDDLENKLRSKLDLKEIIIDKRGDENNPQLILFLIKDEMKGFTEKDLLEKCNNELNEIEKLNAVRVVDSFDKTSSGKIDLKEIKKIGLEK